LGVPPPRVACAQTADGVVGQGAVVLPRRGQASPSSGTGSAATMSGLCAALEVSLGLCRLLCFASGSVSEALVLA